MNSPLRVPPTIAYQGIRNGYSAIRHNQFFGKDSAFRKERIVLLAKMTSDYFKHIECSGGIFLQWKARRWMVKIELALAEEGISVLPHQSIKQPIIVASRAAFLDSLVLAASMGSLAQF